MEIRLRYLLGRRLARNGKLKEAAPYFPTELRKILEKYRHTKEKAESATSSEDRADAWWEVAQLTRHQGMELFGTELEPDWTVDDGQYEETSTTPITKKSILSATTEERTRVSTNTLKGKRFHYRYVAADYALKASRLLPKGSKKLPTILCTAYKWLANRDLKAARPFYKELVSRGGSCP